MQSTTFAFCLVCLVGVTLACQSTGPTEELSHAAAMFRCGPVDQVGTAIQLANGPISAAQVPPNGVEVVIWEPVNALAGRTWRMNTDTAGARYVVGGDAHVSARSGHVTVTDVDGSNNVEGIVDLHFPSFRVATHFYAPWIGNGGTCP